jgi:transposase
MTPWGEKDRHGVEYTTGFKQAMVKKMTGPSRRSAMALAKETGVSQPTLSRWLRAAGNVKSMSQDHERETKQRRPQDWTAEEKLEVVMESRGLSEEEFGAFLRRKGLHEAHLKEWREIALAALGSRREGTASKAEAKRVRELERELKRKDKALAETAALLVLQKKVQALWGDGDNDTEPRRGK